MVSNLRYVEYNDGGKTGMAKFYSQNILTYLNKDKRKLLNESIRGVDFTFKQEYTTMNNLSCFLIQYLNFGKIL